MRTAVVGHLEWIEFARVGRMPVAGEIVHALEGWDDVGGGGAAAAVQLVKLTGDTLFFTAVGDDHLGGRAIDKLESHGLRVCAASRSEPTRTAFTHIDQQGERTITVLGNRLGPKGADALPWLTLDSVRATYFTAGDAPALAHARRSEILVATSRVLGVLEGSDVRLDALVGSSSDPSEAYRAGTLDPPPRLVVMTSGASGGRFWVEGGTEQAFDAVAPPTPIVDRYGAGDSFAAGLTYALGASAPPADAVAFAARCGAAALTGRGPFEGQLRQPHG